MTLDLTMLGEDGKPDDCVAIGVEAHQHLVSRAESLHLSLVCRLRDYYQDATFEPAELPKLLDELGRLQAALLQQEEAERLLVEEMRKLTASAIKRGRGLVALSD